LALILLYGTDLARILPGRPVSGTKIVTVTVLSKKNEKIDEEFCIRFVCRVFGAPSCDVQSTVLVDDR